ncbi:hypothetical protein, conserved [Trypanosoma brucei brucei TREU927]|uniref:Uncharacterized protein n=1 Tax=Trypanosoma brucei brucei (strain 927/4 GUTat10.1) TaxID=185431 RepID=Q585U1_TRYB2|nr:hypothetical protein, conserved [Trypanosoma brucei brucei TREU927]AAQ15988.1 hypothetical protein, conserved [Trypanosoma brucei brucei TREU927]AAX80008.1 hypothetical protein, conserved [Trypanosoma brucei]
MSMDTRMVNFGFTRAALLCGLLLLLTAVCPLHVTAADGDNGRVIVNVKEYFSMPNYAFIRRRKYMVDHESTNRYCVYFGAEVAADQTEAAHQSLQDAMKRVITGSDAFSYLGGDAVYSSGEAIEADKRCKPGDAASSRYCVYRWNKGLFAKALPDGHGVAFWHGSYVKYDGAASMNGYPSFWGSEYPKRGQLYTLSWYHTGDNSTTWYDADGVSGTIRWTSRNFDTKSQDYVIVCEVQRYVTVAADNYTTTTTTTTAAPASGEVPEPTVTKDEEVTVTTVSLEERSNWHIILIALISVVSLIVLLLFLLRWFCDYDVKKEIIPMTLREVVGEPLFVLEPTPFVPPEGFAAPPLALQYYNQMRTSE